MISKSAFATSFEPGRGQDVQQCFGAGGQQVRLLVSVRDVLEMETALAAGAELIDVKEPERGALGAADGATVAAVARAAAGRAPVSAALGELVETADVFTPLPAGVTFAKFGLAQCADLPHWRELWTLHIARLRPETHAVAVVYADWETARAPAPRDVLIAAQAVGCRVVLIDTFDKSGGDLLARWPLDDLRAFVSEVRMARLHVVLAGSLSLESIARILPLSPDAVAVRKAACASSRTGTIDANRVKHLAHFLSQSPMRAERARAAAPNLAV